MHETIEGLRVGLTLASTVGVGGVLFAAGNLIGRHGRGTRNPTRVEVIDNVDKHWFEIRVADEVVGFSQYERRGSMIAFHHTEIDPRFRGQGLGERLIGSALDASRRAGLQVQPHCPFVRVFIEKHSDYADLLRHEGAARAETSAA